jgi:hypothetical protein
VRNGRFPAAASLLAAAGAAPALAAAPILLPSVRTVLTPGPPLRGSAAAASETRVLPGTTNDERVLVDVDPSGKPVAVAVVQRLKISQVGDYTFVVPGPIADVAAARGTDSEPGLRRDAIVWAGFSPGRKTLAARATLRVSAAAALPLRVSVTREGGALVVRGENATAADGTALDGPARLRDAAGALDATRRNLRLGSAAPDLFLEVPRSPRAHPVRIVAPLEVRVGVGGATRTYRLGDGSPLRFELRVPRPPRRLRLHLVVTPAAPVRLLTPPGGTTTWAEAARRRRLEPAGLLDRVSRARLTVARALQYQSFLAAPDPRARSTTTYVYETTFHRATPSPRAVVPSGGSSPWRTVALALVAVVGAGALVVLWAHS